MSAIEETSAAGPAGKDTHATVGGVHPAPGPAWNAMRMVLPQLPYGDAVHITLTEAGLTPDELMAGLRVETRGQRPELYLTLSWGAGHPDLHDPAGLDLLWSHLAGWAARIGHDSKPLPVQDIAAPAVLADAVLHLAVEGLDGAWEPGDRLSRWDGWRHLDWDLTRAAERGHIAW